MSLLGDECSPVDMTSNAVLSSVVEISCVCGLNIGNPTYKQSGVLWITSDDISDNYQGRKWHIYNIEISVKFAEEEIKVLTDEELTSCNSLLSLTVSTPTNRVCWINLDRVCEAVLCAMGIQVRERKDKDKKMKEAQQLTQMCSSCWWQEV